MVGRASYLETPIHAGLPLRGGQAVVPMHNIRVFICINCCTPPPRGIPQSTPCRRILRRHEVRDPETTATGAATQNKNVQRSDHAIMKLFTSQSDVIKFLLLFVVKLLRGDVEILYST